MELNRQFMQDTAELVKKVLPFTTYAAFLDFPTSAMLVDTENQIVYDELLGIPRAKEELLYDLLPVAQTPEELAFKLSEKKVLGHLKLQSVYQLGYSVGPEFFYILADEFADFCISPWQKLFRSQRSDFELLALLNANSEKYFTYLKLAAYVNPLKDMQLQDVRRLMESVSSQIALEILFEAPLQQIYDCIDVFKLQIAKYPFEILVYAAQQKIIIFQSNECIKITFQDFKFLTKLNLSAHELDIMRALYDFKLKSVDGAAVIKFHGQQQVWPIVEEKAKFVKENRLFDLVDVIDGALRSRIQTAAQFCDVVILTVFGHNMSEIYRLEYLYTFSYPQELRDTMLRISGLQLEHFYIRKALFYSCADQVLGIYYKMNQHRNGTCIEGMFVGQFERVALPGVAIQKQENVGIEESGATQRGEIIADFQQKVGSRWVGDGNRSERSLESSIRDMQEHMMDQDERLTVEELFGVLIERE